MNLHALTDWEPLPNIFPKKYIRKTPPFFPLIHNLGFIKKKERKTGFRVLFWGDL